MIVILTSGYLEDHSKENERDFVALSMLLRFNTIMDILFFIVCFLLLLRGCFQIAYLLNACY